MQRRVFSSPLHIGIRVWCYIPIPISIPPPSCCRSLKIIINDKEWSKTKKKNNKTPRFVNFSLCDVAVFLSFVRSKLIYLRSCVYIQYRRRESSRINMYVRMFMFINFLMAAVHFSSLQMSVYKRRGGL